MDSTGLPTRLIILADGTWTTADGSHGTPNHNISTVYRIYTCIKEGDCQDANGRRFKQEKLYYPGIGSKNGLAWAKRLHALTQIREIYEQCCSLAGHPEDEVWFYGFSRGAYVVRAVAGLLHYLRALKNPGSESFKGDYELALKAYSSMQATGKLGPGEIHNYLAASTRAAPTIRFVGVFDTVKAVDDRSLYDISFNNSILHLRHALALNEDRTAFIPEYIFPIFNSNHLQNRSFVQAWFLGGHADMGGASAKDGLSLYPLQWMLLESFALGLILEFDKTFDTRVQIDNTLDVVLPDGVPDSEGTNIWTCIVQRRNGMCVQMQDLRAVHCAKRYRGRYAIHLNKNSAIFWPRQARVPFIKADDKIELQGFCTFAPQGTILHPSVYLILDEYVHILLDSKHLGYRTDIEQWRGNVLPSPKEEFWNAEELATIENLTAIRILVCGNNGVGKSTLINKVFGVTVTKPEDLDQGKHDINVPFTTADRPDLILHDSCGFEAGDDTQLMAVKKFLKDRSEATELEDCLHVIWLCFDINDPRLKQRGTLHLFNTISKYAKNVPIVLVATKKDQFIDVKFGEAIRKAGNVGDRSMETLDANVKAQFSERMKTIEQEFCSIEGGRFDALVGVSKEDKDSIDIVTETTSHCFDNEKVRQLYISAQVTRIDLKVDMAVAKTMQFYKRTVWGAFGSGFAPMGSSIARVAVATEVCKRVVACFGVPAVGYDTVRKILSTVIWDDMGNNIAVMFAEASSVAATVAGVVTGGVLTPIIVATGLINAPIVVPAVARLYLMLGCDAILILAKAFQSSMEKCVGQPLKKDIEVAATMYKQTAKEVHRRIEKVIPRTNVVKSFQKNRVKQEFEKIITEYKENFTVDFGKGGNFTVRCAENDGYDSDFTLYEEKLKLNKE